MADRIRVFNDPNCSSMAGEYWWRLERGSLTFQVIDDPCAFGNERANDLMVSEWTKVPACHRRMVGLWPGFLGLRRGRQVASVDAVGGDDQALAGRVARVARGEDQRGFWCLRQHHAGARRGDDEHP